MLTELSGGQILATCGGMTPGSAAEKSLSAGGQIALPNIALPNI